MQDMNRDNYPDIKRFSLYSTRYSSSITNRSDSVTISERNKQNRPLDFKLCIILVSQNPNLNVPL